MSGISEQSSIVNQQLSIVKTQCPYCGVGCGVLATVQDNRVTKVVGDPSHPSTRGLICQKGVYLTKILDTPDRLLYPQMRTSRDKPFSRVSWDEAIGAVATRLNAIISTHGPDAACFYGSGQLDTEASYAITKLWKGFIGRNHIDSNSRLCMASAVAGYRTSLGADGPPPCYDDIAHADVVLVLGANMAEAHPVLWQMIRERRKSGPLPFLIGVDPRRSKTIDGCDLHLAVRPGADIALCMALAKLIYESGHHDADFIARSCDGWPEYSCALHDSDLNSLAAQCGVPLELLRDTAKCIGEARGFLSFYTMGANQSSVGTAKNNSIINLHLLTGQIGKPGAGPFSLTGQPNAMGGRAAGLLSTSLPGQRQTSLAHDRAALETAWGLSPGAISDQEGLTAVEQFQAAARGEVQALWIAATNPMVSQPDINVVREGLRRAELVVVQDCYHPTETTALADILLPAAQWGEKGGITINSERRVSLSHQAVDAPGESKPDWEIFRDVARAFFQVKNNSTPRPEMSNGHALNGAPNGAFGTARGSFDWASEADIWEEFRALTAGTTCDMSGMTWARLQSGPLLWPCPSDSLPTAQAPSAPHEYSCGASDWEKRDSVTNSQLVGEVVSLAPEGSSETARLYSDGRFPTASGRAQFLVRENAPLAEEADVEFPFVLTTGRIVSEWHSRTRTAKVPQLAKQNPQPFIEIHPDDAARLGLEEGELLRLTGRRGMAQAGARITDRVPRGVLFMAFHWGASTSPHDAACNALTNPQFDPISKQPEFKGCAVRADAVRAEPSGDASTHDEAVAGETSLVSKGLPLEISAR